MSYFRTVERYYPEEDVREAIRNSRGTLIKRLPIPMLLTELVCEKIISEEERSLIVISGTM